MTGTDLTRIDSIDVMSMTILSAATALVAQWKTLARQRAIRSLRVIDIFRAKSQKMYGFCFSSMAIVIFI